MNGPDTLRDRLADLAGTAAGEVPDGRAVRRGAQRDRARRRAVASVAGVVVVAAVAVGGTLLPRTTSTAPATPSPSPTSTVETSTPAPAPTGTGATVAPPPTTTEAPAVPPLTREEAQAFVEAFRFEREAVVVDDEWTTVTTDARTLSAHQCDPVADDRVLAARSFQELGPDTGSWRQVTVFATAAEAAAAFSDLRAAMRPCHVPSTYQDGVYTLDRSVVGGQLDLGDDSFWVGTKDVITAAEGLPARVGTEQPYRTASLFVLDDNVVVHLEDPAAEDDRRAAFVEAASAEWEELRPSYEAVRRP